MFRDTPRRPIGRRQEVQPDSFSTTARALKNCGPLLLLVAQQIDNMHRQIVRLVDGQLKLVTRLPPEPGSLPESLEVASHLGGNQVAV